MPDKECHLAMAKRNQVLIDKLISDGNSHPEWVAVIAFYKALHIVDAVLFATHPDKHGGDHKQRMRILKTTNKYNAIFRYYRPLYSASTVGRYLEHDSAEYKCFADYMSASDVVSILLNHNLRQLEKSAANFIGPFA